MEAPSSVRFLLGLRRLNKVNIGYQILLLYNNYMGRGTGRNKQGQSVSPLPRSNTLDVDETNNPLIRVASAKNRSALIWSETAHREQSRKQVPNSLDGSQVPYLIHTTTVMNILSKANADRDLVCAGCLHDIIEDTTVTKEDLRKEFGSEVTRLVMAVTKDKTFKGIRLEDQATLVLEKCDAVGEDACALKAGDLLANMSDLVWSVEEGGIKKLEEIFGKNRWHRKVAHYIELGNALAQRLPSYPDLSDALLFRIKELENIIVKSTLKSA